MHRLLITIIGIFFTVSHVNVQGSNADTLQCADGLKSISPSSLCNYVTDCADGSDELNFNLCRILSLQKSKCRSRVNEVQCKYQHGQFSYLSQQCMDIITACNLGKKCLSDQDFLLCSEISNNKLKPPFKPADVEKNEEFRRIDSIGGKNFPAELVDVPQNSTDLVFTPTGHFYNQMMQFIEKSLSEAVKKNLRMCQTFYTPLNEKKCISLFTPAQVPWSEARIFCESIGGELAIIDNLQFYTDVLEIIRKRDIQSQFWIGGFRESDKPELGNVTEIIHQDNSTESQNWTWLNGDSVIMGAPFWSLYSEEENEINRRNNVCKNLVQKIMPRYINQNKTCLAILQKNHFYFSDELCSERFAPLCVADKLI